MTGLTQVLNVGISGIEAATQGMQTVSNNTANVNTPGYNMETINQVALNGVDMPAGGLGAGVNVTSVQRAFNQFVYQEILGATATNQSANTVLSNTQNLAGIFPVASGGANGLGQAIGNFFGGANTVAQDPANVPNRAVMLGDAQSVSSLFNSVGAALAANLTTQNQQIGSMVGQINTLTSQIAALNTTIESEEGSTGASPNSLLDQRDQTVQQLAQLIGVNVVVGNDGSENIYATGGATLVAGNTSFSLQATSGSYGNGSTSVIYGPTGQDITAESQRRAARRPRRLSHAIDQCREFGRRLGGEFCQRGERSTGTRAGPQRQSRDGDVRRARPAGLHVVSKHGDGLAQRNYQQ